MSAHASRSSYGFKRSVELPYAEAVERARAALQQEGFGVLCEIDIKDKLREKLGVDFRNYAILGACNPTLAHEALQREIDVGLLLPCNVIVYEDSRGTVVSAVDAAKQLSLIGNSELAGIAAQVNEKLQRVIESI